MFLIKFKIFQMHCEPSLSWKELKCHKMTIFIFHKLNCWTLDVSCITVKSIRRLLSRMVYVSDTYTILLNGSTVWTIKITFFNIELHSPLIWTIPLNLTWRWTLTKDSMSKICFGKVNPLPHLKAFCLQKVHFDTLAVFISLCGLVLYFSF